jgi:hypothetical protein
MPRTADEILTELLALEDQAAVTTALHNSDAPTLKDFRSKQFAAGKKEGESTFKELKKRAAAAESLDDVLSLATTLGVPTERVETVKATIPDRVALEKELGEKSERKVNELRKQLDKYKGLVQGSGKDKALSQLTKLLTASGQTLEQFRQKFPRLTLGDVNQEYADVVLSAKYGDRIVIDDDGNITDVLKPGENSPYEGASLDEKLAFLAADVRKTVPTTFVVSAADRGAGVRGGATNGGQGSGPQLEPVVAAKAHSGDYSM